MSVTDALRRRLSGDFEVDPWGLDRDLVDAASPIARLRWTIEVSGRSLPEGAGVLVFNRRLGLSEPMIVAEAVRRQSGRHLRIVGLPDVPLVGPTMRRFGSVLDHPEEVGSLLREGALVGVPLGLTVGNRIDAGALDHATIAPAVTAGVPVVPVAAVGREIGRAWRVVVGEPLPPVERDDPLTLVRVAEQAQEQVRSLLEATLPPGLLG
ncbi:MAG: hypothetical protein AAGK32_11625 [Actinomycetota bacterium]